MGRNLNINAFNRSECSSLPLSLVQLLCLEDKVTPCVLSALEEDSEMSRLFACRSLSALLRLIGTNLHPEALNKIYPSRCRINTHK